MKSRFYSIFLLIFTFCFTVNKSFAQISTFPFFEGFESATFPPSNWTQDTISGTQGWTSNNGNQNNSVSAFAGNLNAYFYSANYNGDQTQLISPAFDITGLTNPELVFWYTQVDWASDQDTLGVFYKTSSTGTWTYLTSFTSNITNWTEVIVSLPNGSSDYYIAFHGYSGYGRGITIDNVSIREQPTCISPSSLVSSNPGQDSINLNWTENNAATTWIVQYGPAGFPIGTGVDSIVTSRPFTINGLIPNTSYDFYVKSICSVSDTSAWSLASTFTTLFACPSGAVCGTYNSGDIPTDRAFTALPGSSTCPGSLVLTIPVNNRVDSIATEYDMTALGGGWMSEQRSWLYSPNTMQGEPILYNGTGNNGGIFSYARNNLSFANKASGSLVVEMHAGRTFGGAGCDLIYNYVNDGSWRVIAYYSPMPQINAKINQINTPSGALCPGNIIPEVVVANDGIDTITTLDVIMDINGVLDTVVYTGSLASGQVANISFPLTAINSGIVYDITFYTANPNGQADLEPDNDTLRIENLSTGLSGTATLDASLPASASNFQTFTALANQLNSVGVCGSVTVTVAPGTYNDVFYLENILGADSLNTITIDGVDSSLVTLTNNLATERALISFNNTSYVTIKNMTLLSTSTSTTDHFGVHFRNASTYDSLINLRVRMNPTATLGAIGIGASASLTDDFAEGDNASFVTVMNCKVEGGDYSVHFEGPPTGQWNSGNSFINNTLLSADDYGFYFDQQDSLKVIGSTIRDLRTTSAFSGYGIANFDGMNFSIRENLVNANYYGIYCTNANSSRFADAPAEIINNMVTSATNYGIYLTVPVNINLFHNSVRVEGGNEAFYYTSTFADSLDVRNNIFSANTAPAMRTTGADSTVFLKLDNNVYHTTSGANLLNINGVLHANLAAYQAAQANFDIRSLEGDPQFLSGTDLHIIGGYINDAGDNFVGVDIDIDGDPRPAPFALAVDPGADEYDPPFCPPPSNLRAMNASLDSVFIVLDGLSQEYEWNIVSSGAPQGGGLFGVIFSDSARVGALNSSTTYDLYVREICGRGDTSVWIGPITFNTAYGIPYLEDFESFTSRILGNPWPRGWSSSTSTGLRWESLESTGANWSSGGTGPLVDHTLYPNSGGTYVFLETSSGVLGNFADFVSPPIFVDDTLSVIEFSFWYHMHGATMGDIVVMADTNGIRDTLTVISGQQQPAQADPWLEFKTFLNGYNGKSVQLVFRGVKGSSFTGDLAIDDVKIVVPSPINGQVSDILSPISGCGLDSTEIVEVEITNAGTDTLANFSVSYVLNNGTPVTETFTGSILPGLSSNFTFNSTVNVSTPGNYAIKAYVDVVGDLDQSNDTASNDFINIPIVGGFPYAQGFENGNGGWISGGANNTWALGTPANTVINSASNGTQAWVTGLTGPYNNNEASWVESPCFDFSTLNAPIIELDVWWNSEFSWDGAVLQSSVNGGTTWQKVGSFGDPDNWYTDNTINGLAPLEISQEGWSGAGTASSSGWVTAKHDLSGLGNVSGVILRIAFGSDGSVTDEGFAFDSVRIFDAPPINGSIASIVSPTSGCGLGVADSVRVAVLNTGSDTLSNFSITYVLDNGTPVTETFTGFILPTDTVVHTFNSTVNLSAIGSYDLLTYISVAGDIDASNDTLSSNFQNIPIVGGFPYAEGFENGNGGWISGGLNNTWALGTPANTVINSASNGTQAWVTNLTGPYNNNEASWVESPCFDFSSLNAPIIELDVWWESEFSWDGAVLQSSVNGGTTWQKVGAFGDPNNWYTDNTINGLAPLENSQEGWSGRGTSGSAGWVTARHDLTGLANVSGVILRIAFGTDGSVTDEGFAFDSVRIFDPALDATINSLISPIVSVDSCYSASENVVVNLKNEGGAVIDFTSDSALVEVNVSGALTSSLSVTVNNNSLNAGLPLSGNDSIAVPVGLVNLSTPGTYNFEIIVSIPTDPNSANDTLYTTLVIDAISGGIISGNDSICLGDTTIINTANYQGSLQWQEFDGTSWVDINGATSSSVAVNPSVSTDYRAVACGTAFSDTLSITPVNITQPILVNDTVLEISGVCGGSATATGVISNTQTATTYKWYDAATGGNEITSGGQYQLSTNGDSISFTVASTVLGNPVSANVWVEASIGNISCNSARVPLYLFIDCIVGLDNNSLGKTTSLSVYPNPSSGLFTLKINTEKQEQFVLSVRDVKGQLVYTGDVSVNGEYRNDLDFTGFAKGVYYIQIQTETASKVEKLIIQ